MKRKDALTYMRIAGYHGDRASFTRLFIENRVSRDAADAEFHRGGAMKKAGIPCACKTCNQTPKGK